MTAYNVVRFRVKPGREKEFEDSIGAQNSKPPVSAKPR